MVLFKHVLVVLMHHGRKSSSNVFTNGGSNLTGRRKKTEHNETETGRDSFSYMLVTKGCNLQLNH